MRSIWLEGEYMYFNDDAPDASWWSQVGDWYANVYDYVTKNITSVKLGSVAKESLLNSSFTVVFSPQSQQWFFWCFLMQLTCGELN